MIIITTILIYFLVLFIFSKVISRKSADNSSFYVANRKSSWFSVAFGMIGASISGVTFVSVPGMVEKTGMTYMQTCIGFVFGYFAVAFILLPIYYKFKLTTIYTYLDMRLGRSSYKTGASFFLLSKMTGAAVRFYVVCMILQRYVLDPLNVPFVVTVIALSGLIWIYTHKSGMQTIVWTDFFQTICMFASLILIIIYVMHSLNMGIGDAVSAIASDPRSKMFVFDDWISTQNFWKQFVSGIFIVIVMTGLDQDMMQKNLTCKTLKDAQKDMCTYGFAFVPANLLFLSLGILLLMLASHQGISIPATGDELLPMFAATGRMGQTVVVLFTIGIVAASFSSADSALTSLTTSYCIDIKGQPDNETLRKRTHIMIVSVFVLFILLFRIINSTSLIDAIYILCSYTYGPLLGLFAFGLLTKHQVNDKMVPYIAVASPIICYFINIFSAYFIGYQFGYELLMINGAITFLGLYLLRLK